MLLSVGAYSGANLDGGGSSTLVIHEITSEGGQYSVKNIGPADSQRSIPNGIGVFYTVP